MAHTTQNHFAAYAGNIAYHSLFAIFPALISLLWILGILHAAPLMNALVSLATAALPEAASGVIRQQLTTGLPTGHASARMALAAVAAMLVALWAASASFRAMMEALNAIYAVKETRPTWVRYVYSLLLALATSVLLAGALALVVFGTGIARTVAEAMSKGIVLRLAWYGMTWLVLVGLVLGAFGLVYYFGPDVKERFRWISPGTITGLFLWLVFSWAFGFYVNHLVNYTAIYGALAGVAALMIYVYAVSFILLLGAAINRALAADFIDDTRDDRKR